MDEAVSRPRSRWGLIIIGLLLGPVPLMLWLGRWTYALAYLLLTWLAGAVLFALVIRGIVGPVAGFKLSPSIAFSAALYPIVIIGLVHAFNLNKPQQLPFYARWFIALLLLLVVAFVIAMLVRTFLYQPFNIPSASGEPNLMVGDYVFVSKTAYGPSHGPQAGDVAIFKDPMLPQVDFVKRVVGVPGDTIQMIGGVLNINGVPVKLEKVDLPDQLQGADGAKTFFRETLPNGRSYVIADMGDVSEMDDTPLYTVPDGDYFVLGDNRDNSQDSRFLDKIGYVPAANFIGPVVARFWNDAGLPLSGRPAGTF